MTLRIDSLIAGHRYSTRELRENVNPSNTDEVITVCSHATRETVATAVDAAQESLGTWKAMTPQQKADILELIGLKLRDQTAELSNLMAREAGKLLAEAQGEVLRASQIFRFFAQECLRVSGEYHSSTRPGVGVEVRYEPLGVVGLITPWNFPLAIPAWKIAPALAAGNTVVIKPSEYTPALIERLALIARNAGLPDGVFNVVFGDGETVGQALCDNPGVSAISFTGSVATGRKMRPRLAERGAAIQQEMGGKSPLLILDDVDPSLAAGVAVSGSVLSTGQRCTSNSRVIVTKGIANALIAEMKEQISALRVGDAIALRTDLGPVNNEAQLRTNLDYVSSAKKEGATCLTGGERLKLQTPGYYMSPCLISDCHNSMQHVRDEVFGPIVSVIVAEDYEHALDIANDTEFGLSSGICTNSLKHAEDFKRRSTAGIVAVNLPTAGLDYHVPFGGRKASSYGPREQGRHAMRFYTSSKTTYSNSALT